MYIRLAYPVRIGGITTIYPTRTRSQYIINPRGSIGPQEVRYAQLLDASINGIYSKCRGPAPTWSKAIGRKLSDESSTAVNLRFWMNLMHDSVFTKSTKIMSMGLLYLHTSDELGYVFIPTTRIKRLMDGYNWIPSVHHIGEVT